MRLYGSIPVAVPLPVERAGFDGTASAKSHMDEAAFRQFYNEVAPSLRGYIRRACGDAALADDLLQEAFYRFLRADLPPLERWQLKAYLYRAASSLLVDHWRRLKRERRWGFEHLLGEAGPADGTNREGEPMELFRRLKPREQALLWLAYVEGFDHREIGLALQLNEKSVRVLLFRARKRFGEALRQEGFGATLKDSET